jgi:hypothetical protein
MDDFREAAVVFSISIHLGKFSKIRNSQNTSYVGFVFLKIL